MHKYVITYSLRGEPLSIQQKVRATNSHNTDLYSDEELSQILKQERDLWKKEYGSEVETINETRIGYTISFRGRDHSNPENEGFPLGISLVKGLEYFKESTFWVWLEDDVFDGVHRAVWNKKRKIHVEEVWKEAAE